MTAQRIGKEDIAALVPHAGKMCLIEAVTDWSERHILCLSQTHRRAGNPLAKNGALPVLAGVEYAAQAMAIHGGLTRKASRLPRPRLGYLASLRNLCWTVERLDDAPEILEIEAQLLASNGMHVSYGFSVGSAGRLLLSGRAAAVLDA